MLKKDRHKAPTPVPFTSDYEAMKVATARAAIHHDIPFTLAVLDRLRKELMTPSSEYRTNIEKLRKEYLELLGSKDN